MLGPLSNLNRYFFKYRYRFVWGICFVILSNLAGVYPPQVIRYSFDLVKENIVYYDLFKGFFQQELLRDNIGFLLMIFGIVVLLLALLKGLFMFMMRQTLIVMSRLIEYDLRNDMYQHYQQLSATFYKRNKTGDLMSRVSEDVSRVRMYLGPAILYLTNLTFMFLFVIGTMFSINAQLTLWVLLPLPILSFLIYSINKIIDRKSEAIQQQLSQLTSLSQESYSGIRVVKSYVQEQPMLQLFNDESELYKNKSLSLARINAMYFPLILLLVGVSTIITIYMGGIQVMNGTFSSGNIAEFVIYVNMLTWPVSSVGWVASIIQRAAASQRRINEFLHTPADIVSGDALSDLSGNIVFDQVSFRYPDTGILALDKVSFSIKQGEKIALIGKTGSGKTTVADLLVRMYEPTKGEILLDAMPIEQLDLHQLRQQIAYVPQDVFLFSDTIAGNIAFGAPQADEQVVETAARNAHIYKEIKELPQQFETLVGERGVTLSGGQKQRISLARALAKDAEVFVLDDSLSAVDAQTEQQILQMMRTFLADKTAIIITHRVFSLLTFDKILVLDEGKLVAQGTHENLLKESSIYAQLYELQQTENVISKS
ncbi:MAG: ABC transporter ATP-binding protein [Chitinophagales bacterium]|nr:ABC transporter ATP-binding protein [Bacteroidota bacterium]